MITSSDERQVSFALAFWTRDAEASASSDASASCYGSAEDIGVVAIVLPELKLIQIERQIILADVVIGADNSAFQECPEAFDVVRVNLATDVFTLRMLNGFMADATSEMVVALVLVGGDERDLFVNSATNKAGERACIGITDNPTDDLALAFDGSDHADLAIANLVAELIRCFRFALLARLLRPMPVLVLAAYVSFVNFDDAHKLLEAIVLHARAEPMAYIPSRMQRRLVAKEHRANLAGRDAFLALQHDVKNLEPCYERDVGILENRPNQNRKAIGRALRRAAFHALPSERLRGAFIDLGIGATRTLRAGRPAAQSQISAASGLVGKGRHELLERLHS
jgi:hypothetical protein